MLCIVRSLAGVPDQLSAHSSFSLQLVRAMSNYLVIDMPLESLIETILIATEGELSVWGEDSEASPDSNPTAPGDEISRAVSASLSFGIGLACGPSQNNHRPFAYILH